MMADLFESDCWEVRLLGGRLNNDEIMEFIHVYAPDILLIYGCEPKQAPVVRKLIDHVKDINAWPNMRIMLSGGIFNRADCLWEEMGADLFAATAVEAVEQANSDEPTQPQQATIGRRKKRRKSCKTEQKTEVETAEAGEISEATEQKTEGKAVEASAISEAAEQGESENMNPETIESSEKE